MQKKAGGGFKHMEAARRVREERSGRTGKLSTRAKNEEEEDGRER